MGHAHFRSPSKDFLSGLKARTHNLIKVRIDFLYDDWATQPPTINQQFALKNGPLQISAPFDHTQDDMNIEMSPGLEFAYSLIN
jgi:hypothetical protein